MKPLVSALALIAALPGLAFAAQDGTLDPFMSTGYMDVILNVADSNRPTGIQISGVDDIEFVYEQGTVGGSRTMSFCVYMSGLNTSETYSIGGWVESIYKVGQDVSDNGIPMVVTFSDLTGGNATLTYASAAGGGYQVLPTTSGFRPSRNTYDGCLTDGDTTLMEITLAEPTAYVGEYKGSVRIEVRPD